MSIMRKGFVAAVGVSAALLAGAGAAFAQGHGGGGGHAGGVGGGHMSGGHAGGGVAHIAAPHYAGGGHAYGGGQIHNSVAAFHGGAYHGNVYHGGAYAGHGAPAYVGNHFGHGYSTGASWRGGYWRGGFWPRAYYGPGFAWFLPILPLAYATYWYGGVPYYYANDVYYTYDPNYEGYVATDPPPVGDSSPDGSTGPAVGAVSAPPDSSGAGQIYMYPRNGQSAEQQATDKADCQQWATQQAGQVAQNPADYNRAMVACVEGRGYSAR